MWTFSSLNRKLLECVVKHFLSLVKTSPPASWYLTAVLYALTFAGHVLWGGGQLAVPVGARLLLWVCQVPPKGPGCSQPVCKRSRTSPAGVRGHLPGIFKLLRASRGRVNTASGTLGAAEAPALLTALWAL